MTKIENSASVDQLINYFKLRILIIYNKFQPQKRKWIAVSVGISSTQKLPIFATVLPFVET